MSVVQVVEQMLTKKQGNIEYHVSRDNEKVSFEKLSSVTNGTNALIINSLLPSRSISLRINIQVTMTKDHHKP